jgi:hypothetical protein
MHLNSKKHDADYYDTTRKLDRDYAFYDKRRKISQSHDLHIHALTQESLQTQHINSLDILKFDKYSMFQDNYVKGNNNNSNIDDYKTNSNVSNISSNYKPIILRNCEKKSQTLKLVEGTQVEANYEESGTWFPGVIVKSHLDGTFDVCYEDQDFEQNVESKNLKMNYRVVSFTKGTIAVCQYEDGEWYAATIKGLNSEGTYNIIYGDGEEEDSVPYTRLKLQDK